MCHKNKIALVVGGSRGIGRAISLRLATSGFDLCVTYRSNHEEATVVQEMVQGLGQKCDLLSFDIANREDSKTSLEGYFGDSAPDVVVYNAGITRDNPLVWMSDEDWDQVIHTNLDGFYNVMKPLTFNLIKQKAGRVIVISSTSGEIGQSGQVNYSASKAGLIGASKALARELGRKNIFVNVVSPGVIETDMTKDLPADRVLPLIPIKRYGQPEEVAAIVNFLAAEEQMYIHGQVIGVNGGLAI